MKLKGNLVGCCVHKGILRDPLFLDLLNFGMNTKRKFKNLIDFSFNRFRTICPIDSSNILLVLDELTNTVCVLKFCPVSYLTDREYNLRREYIAQANFSHNNLVKNFEAFEDREFFGFTMEYVGGGDLRDNLLKLDSENIPLIIREIALGLLHMHEKGYVHCDLKPENIILCPDGIPKICDFGLTRSIWDRELNSSKKIVGTENYLSPEIIEGREVSSGSDIYSLGLICLELFNKTLPGESLPLVDLYKFRTRLKNFDLDNTVPMHYKFLLEAALQPKLEHRIRDAKQFIEILDQAIIRSSQEDRPKNNRAFRIRLNTEADYPYYRRKTGIININSKKAA